MACLWGVFLYLQWSQVCRGLHRFLQSHSKHCCHMLQMCSRRNLGNRGLFMNPAWTNTITSHKLWTAQRTWLAMLTVCILPSTYLKQTISSVAGSEMCSYWYPNYVCGSCNQYSKGQLQLLVIHVCKSLQWLDGVGGYQTKLVCLLVQL